MFKKAILYTALSLFSLSAMAWNSGSNVKGHNAARAGAHTQSSAVSRGNGFSVNEGAAAQTSQSGLNLHGSRTHIGATGYANTSGLTSNHSYAEGAARAGGNSVSYGTANFHARGDMAGGVRAHDGTRGMYMGSIRLYGGANGGSQTASHARDGEAGGAAYNESFATGDALAKFRFNNRTGADHKTARVNTTSGALSETTRYATGQAGSRTGAHSGSRAGGLADVDAQLRLRR